MALLEAFHVIANLVLLPPAADRRLKTADQRGRPQGALQQRHSSQSLQPPESLTAALGRCTAGGYDQNRYVGPGGLPRQCFRQKVHRPRGSKRLIAYQSRSHAFVEMSTHFFDRLVLYRSK